MPDVCDFRLASNMVANCEKPSIAGLRNNGYIINFDDIDFENSVRDSSNPNIITSLVLLSGKRAYNVYVPGKTPFSGTKKSLVTGTYRNKFSKDVSIVILDNGPDVAKNVIDQLANGTFVVVLENKFAGADGKNTFEIYGFEAGLTATALDDDKYSEESDGGWACTLQETGAPSSGLYLYNTSITATRQSLASLVAGS
ncbi:MAG: hypothetical protein IKW46_02040 [Bacteroidaceae bacterium]|nr:hypothetical protein [Bacteroidaceae bacterium]